MKKKLLMKKNENENNFNTKDVKNPYCNDNFSLVSYIKDEKEEFINSHKLKENM